MTPQQKEIRKLFRQHMTPGEKVFNSLLDNLGWIALLLAALFVVAFSAFFHASVYPVAAVVGTVIFLIWCWAANDRHDRAPSRSLVVVARRLIWMHIKLALKLGFGFVLAFFAIMSILGEAGAYSKSMTVYGKGPELERYRSFSGRVWHEAASFLAPLALLICILSSWVEDFYLAHTTPCNLALFGLYLVWLWVAVRDIVRDEYTEDKTRWAFRSVAAIGVWAVVVLASAWGVHRLFAGMWS